MNYINPNKVIGATLSEPTSESNDKWVLRIQFDNPDDDVIIYRDTRQFCVDMCAYLGLKYVN